MSNILDITFSTDIFPAELIVSLGIILIITILSLIVYFKSKKVDPLEKPKGIMLLAEMYVSFIDKTIGENLGIQFKKIAGAVYGGLYIYLFMSMLIGLLGFESPISYLYIPVTLGLTTFILIHATAAHYNKWKYFHRYIEPIPVMLPINLLSMWAPLLSLSFRLFGNAVAGYVIMRMVYWAFKVNHLTFAGGYISPAVIVAPVLHAYFDVFSAYIQTTVFTLLSMALIKNEVPEDIANQKEKEYKESLAKLEEVRNLTNAMNK